MKSEAAPLVSTERRAGIAIRTVHIIVASIYVGGRLWEVPPERLRVWRHLTTATGVALLISEARHSPNWAHQGRGLTTMAHIGVLVPGHVWPQLANTATVVAMAIGSVGSHLPRSVRKWSVLRGGVMP